MSDQALKEGKAAFWVLVDENDQVVDAKVIDGKHGKCWMLSDKEEARFGRKFVPMDQSQYASHDGRSRVQEQLGLRQVWEIAEAEIKPIERFTGGYLGGARVMDREAVRVNPVSYGSYFASRWGWSEDDEIFRQSAEAAAR